MHTSRAVVLRKPNPQGKGEVGVLRDWALVKPQNVTDKTAARFLRDYCLSALVLAAEFQFRPVVGRDYYLYASDGQWKLSLIAPEEWADSSFGECFGRCRLRADATWEVEPLVDTGEGSAAVEAAKKFARGFVETLRAQDDVTQHLPFYVAQLGYHQRMLATALASSLQQSFSAPHADIGGLLEEGVLLGIGAGR